MAKTELDHAARDRLLSDVESWLPSTDPASRRRILDLLTRAAATGADPIATLRDGLRQWFGTGAPAMLPRSPSPIAAFEAATIPFELLIGPRRPTLWPQRPKRLVDELFSSWLWRCATASHISPALFAADVLVLPHGDIDRDVAPETVCRLARRSGQTFASLAAGTLPLTPAAPQDTIGGMVEDLLMTEDRLLLASRPDGGMRRRDYPILAYCPRCLASDSKPYFRRRWRLAPFVVCLTHRTMLLDRCWNCQSRIDVLTSGETGPQPSCGSCGVLLSAAPATTRAAAAARVPRQRNLEAMLAYLVTRLPADQRVSHLRTLSRQFSSGILHGRARVIAALIPATAHVWFGAPIDPRHDAPLRMLAKRGRHGRDGARRSSRAGSY
ncbi:MAG TPA: TniQ family protein [Acidisphaera sp.]|nr:TniQ family protein [Acidisphaera sp.]